VIRDVVCSEALGKLAASIMGWNSTRIGQDDVIHKPPLSSAVGFHQDGAYISDNFLPSTNNCLTLWIALDDADEENGALQYAPGSHLWPYQPVDTVAESSFHAISDKIEENSNSSEKDVHFIPLREAAKLAGKDPDEVQNAVKTIQVGAGEMVVHHQQLWHGSGPNRSKIRTRRALVAHLINGQVQWRTSPPPHYIYGRYFIRGESFPREDFLPILYSDEMDVQRTSWLSQGNQG
jgi:ectoine hydroxylase-related dioxygenase (phytanoyl-CoA dioxygenase family)